MSSRAKYNIKNLAIVIVTVSVILAGTYLINNLSRKRNTLTIRTNTPENSTKYADGTYVADAVYTTSGGHVNMGIEITLEDGVIVDSIIEADPSNPTSLSYQQDFIESYKEFVVGKKIEGLKLDKVSRSSLTTVEFNDALEKIREEARI